MAGTGSGQERTGLRGAPDSDRTLVVGRITGCYGVKGWVKIHTYTDTPENFLAFGEWMVQRRGGPEPVEFDAGRPHGKGLVAHIAGVDDRTAAEAFRGLEVTVARESLPALEEGEFYWHQLQGLQVWCTEGEQRALLGRVDYLIETGANDVLVVSGGKTGADNKEHLVPWTPGLAVLEVDLGHGLIRVDWDADF